MKLVLYINSFVKVKGNVLTFDNNKVRVALIGSMYGLSGFYIAKFQNTLRNMIA